MRGLGGLAGSLVGFEGGLKGSGGFREGLCLV